MISERTLRKFSRLRQVELEVGEDQYLRDRELWLREQSNEELQEIPWIRALLKLRSCRVLVTKREYLFLEDPVQIEVLNNTIAQTQKLLDAVTLQKSQHRNVFSGSVHAIRHRQSIFIHCLLTRARRRPR